MDEGDGMKYYVMLRMEGEFPGRVESLKWEIHEAAYDDFLREFDDYWNRVFWMTSENIYSPQDEESPEQMKERIKKRDDAAIAEMENTTYQEYMAIRRNIRIALRLNRAAIEKNEVREWKDGIAEG